MTLKLDFYLKYLVIIIFGLIKSNSPTRGVLTMSDNTPQDLALMQILNLVATVPSLIATLWMIYFCFKGLSANISMKLIFPLAISDFVYSTVNLMPLLQSTPDSSLCDIEGVFRNLSSNFSICLAPSIALLHYHIIKMDPGFNKTKFLTFCIVGGALASLSLALRYANNHQSLNILSPFYVYNTVKFSKSGIKCSIISIRSDLKSELLVIFFYKAFFPVTGTIITLISYLKTIKVIGKMDQLLLSKKLNTQKLLWYPVAIFMMFLPNLIYYIVTFCFDFEYSTFWDGATMLITHSLGTVNAIIYGLQRKVYKDTKRVSAVGLESQRNRQETVNWENVKEGFSVGVL